MKTITYKGHTIQNMGKIHGYFVDGGATGCTSLKAIKEYINKNMVNCNDQQTPDTAIELSNEIDNVVECDECHEDAHIEDCTKYEEVETVICNECEPKEENKDLSNITNEKYRNGREDCKEGRLKAIKSLWYKRRLIQSGNYVKTDVTMQAIGVFAGCIPLTYAFDKVNGFKDPQKFFDKKVKELGNIEVSLTKTINEFKEWKGGR